jgi:hypothetical protein
MGHAGIRHRRRIPLQYTPVAPLDRIHLCRCTHTRSPWFQHRMLPSFRGEYRPYTQPHRHNSHPRIYVGTRTNMHRSDDGMFHRFWHGLDAHSSMSTHTPPLKLPHLQTCSPSARKPERQLKRHSLPVTLAHTVFEFIGIKPLVHGTPFSISFGHAEPNEISHAVRFVANSRSIGLNFGSVTRHIYALKIFAD